jgi:competence protein ComGC
MWTLVEGLAVIFIVAILLITVVNLFSGKN